MGVAICKMVLAIVNLGRGLCRYTQSWSLHVAAFTLSVHLNV